MTKETIRLEYQQAIDRTNKFHFTVFIALNTLIGAITHYDIEYNHIDIFIALISVVFYMLIMWYNKIDSLNKLMIAQLLYWKEKKSEDREYFDFIDKKMDSLRKTSKHKVMYPNWGDDMLPKLCGLLFILMLVYKVIQITI